MRLSVQQNDMKHQFSRQLVFLLEQAYGGRIPSLSVLARDISLQAPHLPHVSSEAVRKWIRGSTIPQSPRMQALAEWLGDDLFEPLMRSTNESKQTASAPLADHHLHHLVLENSISLLKSLDPDEKRLVFDLLQSMTRRRPKPRAPAKTTTVVPKHSGGSTPNDLR